MKDTQFYLNGNKENRPVSVHTIEDGKWIDF